MKPQAVYLAISVAVMSVSTSLRAQDGTFQSFVCADGARFTAAFPTYDPKQVRVQIDGKAVTLRKRFTLTGARYTGRGVTLTMNRSGTILRHGRRGATKCMAG